MTRRQILQMMIGTLATGIPISLQAYPLPFQMPAEWTPHARCFMALCAAYDLYDEKELDDIQQAQARVAQAIAQFEPVTMLVDPDEDMPYVRNLCGPSVTLLPMAHYDVWTRDTLPTFVHTPTGLNAIGWNFNVWGNKFPKDEGYELDKDLGSRLAAHLNIPFVQANIICEGGAIEVDGEGTLLTTETCLLNPNRNHGLSRTEIEADLMRLTGCSKVIWLYGSDADKITNGHIDGIARFVEPGVVLAEVSSDPEDPEYDDLQRCALELEKAQDARGRKLEVIRIERPRWEKMSERGPDFAASYINCYEANGGIVIPRFGDMQRDAKALAIFKQLRPNHKIVQVEVDAICEGGGGIHCNTQQLPIFKV